MSSSAETGDSPILVECAEKKRKPFETQRKQGCPSQLRVNRTPNDFRRRLAGLEKPGNWASLLRGSFSLDGVISQRQARLVAVAGVLMQHALRYGLIDGGHGGMEEIARRGRVTGSNGGAEAAHHGADARAVDAVHFRALTSLRRALQNRLFLLLDFGRLSLRHLSLLKRIIGISNVKRRLRLCQTTQIDGSARGNAVPMGPFRWSPV